MAEFSLMNRHEQTIRGRLLGVDGKKEIAIIMHGLSGHMDEPHLEVLRSVFLQQGYGVVLFDCTNSINSSGGNYEFATLSGYLDDLEDVIRWLRGESVLSEGQKITLAGHSMGGFAVCRYTQIWPDDVKQLIAFAPVISGKTMLASREKYHPEVLAEWRRSGYLAEKSESRPGVVKRLRWHPHITDSMRHDLLLEADKTKARTLAIYGSDDLLENNSAISHYFDALRCNKKQAVIAGGDHNLTGDGQLDQLAASLSEFLAQ